MLHFVAGTAKAPRRGHVADVWPPKPLTCSNRLYSQRVLASHWRRAESKWMKNHWPTWLKWYLVPGGIVDQDAKTCKISSDPDIPKEIENDQRDVVQGWFLYLCNPFWMNSYMRPLNLDLLNGTRFTSTHARRTESVDDNLGHRASLCRFSIGQAPCDGRS